MADGHLIVQAGTGTGKGQAVSGLQQHSHDASVDPMDGTAAGTRPSWFIEHKHSEVQTVLRAHLNDLIASDVRPCRVRDQAVDWKSAERNWGPVCPNIACNLQSSWLRGDLSGFARIFDRFASGDISGVVGPTIRGDKLQAVQVQVFKRRSVYPDKHGRYFALLLIFNDALNDVSGR